MTGNRGRVMHERIQTQPGRDKSAALHRHAPQAQAFANGDAPYGLMCFMAPLGLTGPVYGFLSNRKSFHLGGRDGQNQQQCHSFC